MRITRKAEVDLSRMYRILFLLTADTVLTAETVMSDYKKVNNMSTFPRRMTISRKQTGLIKASLRDYVNVVSGRRPSTAVDPIQTLVDEYVANVTAAGHTVGEAAPYTKLYNFFDDLVTSGDWADASCYFYAHEMGYSGVDDGGTTRIRQAYPLKKVSGSWLTSDDNATVAYRPARSATTIWGVADTRRHILQNTIDFGTDSFEIEIKANLLCVAGVTHEYCRSQTGTTVIFFFRALTNDRFSMNVRSDANVLEAQPNWGPIHIVTDADVTIKLVVTRTGGATFVAELFIDGVSKGTTSGNWTGSFTNLHLGSNTTGAYSFKKFEWFKINKL